MTKEEKIKKIKAAKSAVKSPAAFMLPGSIRDAIGGLIEVVQALVKEGSDGES